MSKETLKWLNENTLIGFTDKRGPAWHGRRGDDNHYAGAIPVEDVQKRLFDWKALEQPLYVEVDVTGNGDTVMMPIDDRKAMVRSDNHHVMGIFKQGYQGHDYSEWLVQNIGNILDDELGIGSAGLLRGGAQAWVSVEVPETITTPEGVSFRPNLTGCTSFDGSLATTFKRHVTNIVCDNTMGAALGEQGQVFRVKHSKNSGLKINDAREALAIVHNISDAFAEQVAALCAVKVNDNLFERILDVTTPLPEADATNRAQTMAENKRDALWTMWQSDARVVEWNGTAFGVWQAYNTYQHHGSIVRGASRQERNLSRAIDGTTEAFDTDIVATIMAMAS